jgi:plasmid stabilization system protein ParE
MSLRVKISARAAAEIRRAADWWLTNRPAAPGAIGTDFADAGSLLAEQPGIGAKYEGTRVLGVRRLFLSRDGHFIYYTADAKDLKILAFWHSSREHQPRL